MDTIKNVYIDSRYKTNDSVSNNEFKLEIKEALGLGENTQCYTDDISIPHTFYTIENYTNQLYIETTNNSITNGPTIILPNGNYTASSLATTLTLALQTRCPETDFSCNENNNVGTIKITNSSNSQFRILTDDTIVSLQGVDWYGDGGDFYTVLILIIYALSLKFSEIQFSLLQKRLTKVAS